MTVSNGVSGEIGASGRPEGLESLSLKPEYRSDTDDLVRDFYVPCLRQSQLYLRAVGFFTSRGLSVAAQGLTEFIDKGGQMRLVASPLLDPEDIEAIERGYAARQNVVEKALLRQIEAVSDAATRDRLGYLAWLIAEERLEMKIAVPLSTQDVPRLGIYHEKLGLFEDRAKGVVAFIGSPNETAGGLVDNFETIDVFWSCAATQELLNFFWYSRHVSILSLGHVYLLVSVSSKSLEGIHLAGQRFADERREATGSIRWLMTVDALSTCQ